MVSEPADKATGDERRGWARFLKPLLIASLALNLLIIGALASSVWVTKRHGGGADGAHGRGEIGIKGFIRQLPPERRKELQALLPKRQGALLPLKQAVVAARQGAAAKLAAEPFDAEALRRSFSEIETADTELRAAAREAVITAAVAMTADERRRLAAWWQQKKPYLFRTPADRESRRRAKREDGAKSQTEP